MARLEELSGGKGSRKGGYNTLERLEPPAGPKGATTPSRTRPSEPRSPAPALQPSASTADAAAASPWLCSAPSTRRGPGLHVRRESRDLPNAHPRSLPAAHTLGRPRAVESAGSGRSSSLRGPPGAAARAGAGTTFHRPRLQRVQLIRPPHLQTLPQPGPSASPSPPRSRPSPSPSPASPFRPRFLPLLVPSASSDANHRLHHLLPRAVPPNPPLSLQSPLVPSGAPARAGGESPQPGAETKRGLSGGCGILPGPVWRCWKKRRGEKAASPDESAPPVEKLRCGHPLSWRWAARIPEFRPDPQGAETELAPSSSRGPAGR
ncbi:nascent polypeptide-associated complex subunit alpha, muscle-specific form-like [Hylobates moloch]|uniref:nascent polypeptide-associated complex subunit alpha, muscle-specific form-like n=1 Tax=Hylobates moloch TaxID=81572 RepID=UPI00136292A2|nr:nascent polypeptide-associated complex subunit alpha, muscle-specific form-like [Hylobates moloch]